MLNVYIDESCKEGHRYLILGGIAVEEGDLPTVLKRLQQVRDQHGTYGEVKWVKVSRSKLAFYEEFAGVFFELSRAHLLHFHGMVVDTETFRHAQWNDGDSEIGFNKLVYQLLLHKFGRRYGSVNLMNVYLDARSSKGIPDTIRPMLNNALDRSWGIKGSPFRRLTFQDSKSSDLLQLNDLLIGAIGARTNGHHTKPDAAQHKAHLAKGISRQAGALEYPIQVGDREAVRFTLWKFRYSKKDGF